MKLNLKTILLIIVSLHCFVFSLHGALEDTSLCFAIIADPQLNAENNRNQIGLNAATYLKTAVMEINNSPLEPSFVIFLGDLVNVFNTESVEHFKKCIKDLKAEPILVNGNHDTRPPFKGFLELSGEISGAEKLYYSFDRKDWHFIVLPCDLRGSKDITRKIADEMAEWLKKDLINNKDKKTVIFEHFPLMPQGLSQLEWYTFHMAMRNELLDLITTHGNVKYYFNGHVHNGIKAAEKLSWKYKGIEFITVPTIIQPREFGEEYPEFLEGLNRGGYYMTVKENKGRLMLYGHLAGVNSVHKYEKEFNKFTDSTEPRWLSTIGELPANKELINGDFEDGLNGWMKSYRYLTEKEPIFRMESEIQEQGELNTVCRLATTMKKSSVWSKDEHCKIYQLIEVPEDDYKFLKFSYMQPTPFKNGGFAVQIVRFSHENAIKQVHLYSSGIPVEESNHLLRSMDFELYGNSSSDKLLSRLETEGKITTGNIPVSNKCWKSIQIDISNSEDQPIGDCSGDKIYISFITWVNNIAESHAEIFIDDVCIL